MKVPVNKVRQHNSFIAGARAFKSEFLGTLAPMLPPEARIELEKVASNILKDPKYKKIGGKAQTKWRKLAQRKKR